MGVYDTYWICFCVNPCQIMPNLLLEQGCIAIMAWHVFAALHVELQVGIMYLCNIDTLRVCVRLCLILRHPNPTNPGSIHWDSTRFPTSYQLVTWLPHQTNQSRFPRINPWSLLKDSSMKQPLMFFKVPMEKTGSLPSYEKQGDLRHYWGFESRVMMS